MESSDLVPGATRWWDLEFENPTWEYPDYDNFIEEIDGTWKKSFRFRLESAELEDFQNEVRPHRFSVPNCITEVSYDEHRQITNFV